MLIKDRLEITSGRTYTDEGFLVVPSRIARMGIQEYLAIELGLQDREPMDIVRIYRPPEEVFSDESLTSFANKPVTDDHPDEMVSASNFKDLAVGFSTSEVVQDGIFAKTILHITDKKAITKVESGKVELSNGYTSDIEWKSGVTSDGESYDAIQRNIRGNHIALVDKGRCGAACRVSDHKPQEKDVKMPLFTIDGVDFEMSEQAAQAVGKLNQRLADAEENAEKAKKSKEDTEEEKEKMAKDHQTSLDTLQAKLDDAQAKIPGPEMLDQLVNNRMTTRDAALKINPDFEFKGKDCEIIRKEIVADACADIDVEQVSADYIRARFDAMVATKPEGHNVVDQALQDQNRSGTEEDKDKPMTADAAYQARAERNRNLWKGGAK